MGMGENNVPCKKNEGFKKNSEIPRLSYPVVFFWRQLKSTQNFLLGFNNVLGFPRAGNM